MHNQRSLETYAKVIGHEADKIRSDLKTCENLSDELNSLLQDLAGERASLDTYFNRQFSKNQTFNPADLHLASNKIREVEEEIACTKNKLMDVDEEIRTLTLKLTEKLSEKKSLDKLITSKMQQETQERVKREWIAMDDRFLTTRTAR